MLLYLNKVELNCIENLSNEIFYEVFDYLDGLDIYIAFSNLNDRFQQLITCSSIQYKINLNFLTTKQIFFDTSKEIKNQIYSLNFQLVKTSMNDLLTLFTIDCCYSYNNLQSISIEDIEKNQLIYYLIIYLIYLVFIH